MPRNAALFVALGVTQFRSNVSDAMGRGNELAHALLGIESHVTKDTRRNPTGIAAAYFAQLVEWGYAASEVEQIVLDATEKTAESSAAETAEEQTSE